jgi:hypothetical protein
MWTVKTAQKVWAGGRAGTGSKGAKRGAAGRGRRDWEAAGGGGAGRRKKEAAGERECSVCLLRWEGGLGRHDIRLIGPKCLPDDDS